MHDVVVSLRSGGSRHQQRSQVSSRNNRLAIVSNSRRVGRSSAAIWRDLALANQGLVLVIEEGWRGCMGGQALAGARSKREGGSRGGSGGGTAR